MTPNPLRPGLNLKTCPTNRGSGIVTGDLLVWKDGKVVRIPDSKWDGSHRFSCLLWSAFGAPVEQAAIDALTTDDWKQFAEFSDDFAGIAMRSAKDSDETVLVDAILKCDRIDSETLGEEDVS